MNVRRVSWIGVILVAAVVTLSYLRDPPWLAGIESGFRGWQVSEGVRYRWIDGHASFFVPANAISIVIPARTTFGAGDPPQRISISIDDRKADELILTDEGWQMRRLLLPPPGARRLRRIDIRVDRVRQGNRGAQIGEVTVVMP